jgi:hypothetical protein
MEALQIHLGISLMLYRKNLSASSGAHIIERSFEQALRQKWGK